jgi:capsular polysaccharide biosynthesis protein
MELKSYIKILMKRLWAVILIPLFMGTAAAVVSLYVVEPEYESSITLYVMNKDFDSRLAYDDFLASQQLIKDCRELIKSRSTTKAVIQQLNIEDFTEEELAQRITVDLKNDTRLLEIKVRDTNNVRAKEIADEISIIFQKKINELVKLQTLAVVDEAEIPDKPSSPNVLVNTVLAFLLTGFLVICALFLKEYLDDTLKNSEDIEKVLGIKVIAIIPALDME